MLLLWATATHAQVGVLTGRVVDSERRVPLEAVEVRIDGTALRALTDRAGRYRFGAVPAGVHVVRAEGLGHVPAVRPDVVVRPGRATVLDLELRPAAFVLEALVARPSVFASAAESPGSRIDFAAEEIRRAPGSAGDVSRILYGLPAVAKVNDQSNGLAVRGGTPSENLFLVDNMAVPNVNHFPAQGATSGPIGLLNVELIRDVAFHAGGFGAEHGNRLSAVLSIELRDGSPERRAAQLAVDFTGAGAVLEGPAGGRTTWIAAVRRSYLDLLVNAVDVGATVAPRYGDYALRTSTEVSDRHRITTLALWADDDFRTDLAQALEHGMTAFGAQQLVQGTTGLNWRALWSERLHSETSLAHTYGRFREDYTETAARTPLFRNRSTEHAVQLRHRTRRQLSPRTSVTVGGEARWLAGGFDNVYEQRVNTSGDTLAALHVAGRPAGVDAGAFLTLQHALAPSLQGRLGMRVEHATLSGAATVSPRASLSWDASGVLTFGVAGGVYRQQLPLLLLAQPAHRDLRPPLALHGVLSAAAALSPGTRLTADLYHKRYRNLPMDPQEPALMPLDEVVEGNAFFTARERLVDAGRADASGAEIMLQKKLTGTVHGIVSGSVSRLRYRGLDGGWRPRAFDNRYMFSAEGGWKPTPRWDLSARWIYAGGPPRTPLDTLASARLNRTVLDTTRVAGARFPAYHSLNVRADRRFHAGGSTLLVYLSVWNAYDRANVASYYWNTATRAVATTHQWRLLPIFGIEWNL
jgi:hypothetical protein